MRPTIFDLFHGIAIIGGIVIGAQRGFKLFGDPGALAGGILGAPLGFAVGYLCNRLLDGLMMWKLKRQSNQALRDQLVDGFTAGTYVSGLIISMLVERGEPVESFREFVFRQLHSEDVTWRKAGLYTLEICYPELAVKLGRFNPFHPTEDDLQRLNEIESMSMGGKGVRLSGRIVVPYQPTGTYRGLTWRAMPGK